MDNNLSSEQTKALLEKVLLAGYQEQRSARRWKLFFRGIYIAIFVVIAFIATRGVPGLESSHVAVIEVLGEIHSGSHANANDLIQHVTEAFKNPSAKGIILKINSPGGTPVDAMRFFDEMQYLRSKYPEKKVVALIEDLGASAAYIMAMSTPTIYAHQSSIVGSIGVIFGTVGLDKIAEKIGVEARVVASGPHKDFMNPLKPVDPAQVAHMTHLVQVSLQDFTQRLESARGQKLSTDKTKLYSGLFWLGEEAKSLGLVDEITSGQEALLRDYFKQTNAIVYNPLKMNPFDLLTQWMDHHIDSLGRIATLQLRS